MAPTSARDWRLGLHPQARSLLRVVEAEVVDALEEFAADFCVPRSRLTRSTGRYPTGPRSRDHFVRHLVAAARTHGATWSRTAAREGQRPVRFEAGLAALAPDCRSSPRPRDFAGLATMPSPRRGQGPGPAPRRDDEVPLPSIRTLWAGGRDRFPLADIWNAPIERYTTRRPRLPPIPQVVVTFIQWCPWPSTAGVYPYRLSSPPTSGRLARLGPPDMSSTGCGINIPRCRVPSASASSTPTGARERDGRARPRAFKRGVEQRWSSWSTTGCGSPPQAGARRFLYDASVSVTVDGG